MWFLVLLFLCAALAWAEDLGELSANPFNPASTANPFGAGSPFKPDGLNNPFSPYGNPFSNQSATRDNLGSGLSIDLRASFSNPSSTISPGAYFRYYQHQPCLTSS